VTEDVRTALRDLIKRFKDDPKLAAALIESGIEVAGSKVEANRLVNAAKVRGNPGRATEYFMADAHVLFGVSMLERDYRRRGAKVPKRSKLIKEAISREIADGRQLGKTENAAIQRIRRHSSLVEMFSKAGKSDRSGDRGSLREFWTDEARQMPPVFSEWILTLDRSSLNYFSDCVIVLWLLEEYERKYLRSDEARSETVGHSLRVKGPRRPPQKK
jgi:hypothetical protein